MPKLELPPGWPDPYTLLKDPDWEDNYPKILLRGIYDIMTQGRITGDLERRYIAGFNITLWRLTNAKIPRFFPNMIKKGVLSMDVLTSKGKEREAEVTGLRSLSAESKKRNPDKSRSDMRTDTIRKMHKLRKLLELVIASTAEEGMPPRVSSSERGGG